MVSSREPLNFKPVDDSRRTLAGRAGPLAASPDDRLLLENYP